MNSIIRGKKGTDKNKKPPVGKQASQTMVRNKRNPSISNGEAINIMGPARVFVVFFYVVLFLQSHSIGKFVQLFFAGIGAGKGANAPDSTHERLHSGSAHHK